MQLPEAPGVPGGAGGAGGVIVYVTTGSEEEARRIGRQVVEERLAGCANVVPRIASYYWWEGRLVEDTEALLLLKTVAAAVPRLMERVRALHSYTVPAISAVPIARGNPAYMAWLAAEVRPGGEAAGERATGGQA